MDSFFSPNAPLEPLGVSPPLPDDGPSWLVTFSDLVLQLFAFLLIGLMIGQVPPQPATESLVHPPPEMKAEVVPSDAPQSRRAVGLAALAVAEATVLRLAPQAPRAPAARERSAAAAAPAPLDTHEASGAPPAELVTAEPEPRPAASAPAVDSATAAIAAATPAQIRAAGQYLAALVSGAASGAAPEVAVHEDEVVVTLADGIGFASGRSELSGPVKSVLGELRDIVRSMPGAAIEVSGHTDDQPIRTAKFPSNLELSLARAAAVAQFLADGDADLARRIFAAGYAERRPRASNADARGRAQNRRVEIRLIALR